MTPTIWTDYDHAGFLPEILLEDDGRTAVEQLNDRYAHGGGFHASRRFTFDPETLELLYPGDPPLRLRSQSNLPLSQENLYLYDSAFLVIVDMAEPKAWQVCRVD